MNDSIFPAHIREYHAEADGGCFRDDPTYVQLISTRGDEAQICIELKNGTTVYIDFRPSDLIATIMKLQQVATRFKTPREHEASKSEIHKLLTGQSQ